MSMAESEARLQRIAELERELQQSEDERDELHTTLIEAKAMLKKGQTQRAIDFLSMCGY